jgi:AmiR/NasT family two-component response regulator
MPIILCIGCNSIVDEQQAKACGVQGVIMKPFTREALGPLLKELLHGGAPPVAG